MAIKDTVLKILKDNIKYFIVFSMALFSLIFFGHLNSYESVWNYGFSYAFAIGEIPYVEFNMIIPGFYNFIMSLGLHISHNNLVFLIEQSILITLTFLIVYKMYGKKAWIFLFFMSLLGFFAFCPTYNFFLMFLTILIIYLEKEKSSDYLIGFLLGLCILTKHTVGVFLIIPSFIFYFKDKKKLFKRFIGCLVPCVIFVIYLLIIGAFKEFFDLCILGLFDFASKNSELIIEYVVFSIILLVLTIVYIVFNKKDVLGYYLVSYFSVMIPIFSYYHFSLYLAICSLMLLSTLKLSDRYLATLGISFTMIIFSFYIILNINGEFLSVHNFNYVHSLAGNKNNFEYLNKLYLKYSKQSNTNVLSSKSVWIKVSNEEKLNYFTIINRGNFGYNGTKKMIDKVNKETPTYYIIDMPEYERTKKYTGQFDVELCDYIINNSKLVEKTGNYEVYLK
ncbi:MAG: hypothetical protein UE699_06075 [Bacilli bacterium]|nr:hypothetical protein [Bacilli bacterium]